MKVKSESEVAQSCPTLSDPMDYSRSGSSIHGIFQARILEWGAIAFSELLPRTMQIPIVIEMDVEGVSASRSLASVSRNETATEVEKKDESEVLLAFKGLWWLQQGGRACVGSGCAALGSPGG